MLMKNLIAGASLATLGIACLADAPAYAKPAGGASNLPTLHGFCNTSDAGCIDNNVNTPTTLDPPDFGFSAGGHAFTSPAGGDVRIDILVPDTALGLPSFYTLTGPLIGTATDNATLFSPTPWTSGPLDDYLKISASPTNPIGGFGAGGVTGYYVFQADLGGGITLPSNSGANNSDLLLLGQTLPVDSYIVAFVTNDWKTWGATSSSGAILEMGGGPGGHGTVPEPSTWAMMAIGFMSLGDAGFRKAKPWTARAVV
jgi:hypothetical protein